MRNLNLHLPSDIYVHREATLLRLRVIGVIYTGHGSNDFVSGKSLMQSQVEHSQWWTREGVFEDG